MIAPLHLHPRLLSIIPRPKAILGLGEDESLDFKLYRVSRGYPCPKCGGDSKCIVIPDPKDTTLRHVYCHRATNDAILDNFGFMGHSYYWRFVNGTDTPIRTTPQRRQIPLSDDAAQNIVLRAVARDFGLSAAHKAKLAARGYDPNTCGPDGRYLFCSLPADKGSRLRMVNRLLLMEAAKEGSMPYGEGILGFAIDRRRGADAPVEFLPRTEGTALLELRCDVHGQITGFEYAPDVPRLDKDGKPIKRESPARLVKRDRQHVARPASIHAAEVWHTEGIHKANLTADRRSVIALGALGKGNTSGLVAGAQAVDPRATQLHVVALDAAEHGGKEETALARRLYEVGYRVALARWDVTHNGPDDALVAGAAITLIPYADTRPQPHKDTRFPHVYPWQRSEDSPADHVARLAEIGARMAQRVEQHITTQAEDVLIIASPPGLGKTTQISKIGEPSTAYPDGRFSLAWIAQRHDMVSAGSALTHYRHIEAANAHNCESWKIHEELAKAGYNTAAIHTQHGEMCRYSRQFREKGSAVYMVPHVRTPHPTQHDGIVIDEFDISTWISDRIITISMLHKALAPWPTDSTGDQFLRAIQGMITDATQAHAADPKAPLPHGAALFDLLNRQCNGQLVAWLGALGQDDYACNERPWPTLDIHEVDAEAHAAAWAPVVMPHILKALIAELAHWQHGETWNSRLRIGASPDGLALIIAEPLRFEAGKLPPLTILDATADDALMRRIWQRPITIERAEVDPPAHMQHIAVRTGKRYGKYAMTNGAHRDRYVARAIAEAKYLLAELDPDGSKSRAGHVGLITFRDCERDIGDALEIPAVQTGHFWGMRGSNRLEACEILLIIGTPAPAPDQVVGLARALYFGETAINEAYDEETGTWIDPRVQHLAEYLIRAELTQCAHRNRPLRHDGHVVISMCHSEIDFLPITTEIAALPHLTCDGEELRTKRQAQAEERIRAAIATLGGRGEPVTVRAVAALAQVQHNAVSAWMRANHNEASIVNVLPETEYRSYCISGNVSAIHPADIWSAHAPPPDVAYAPVGARMPRFGRIQHLLDHGYSPYDAERISWQEAQAVG